MDKSSASVTVVSNGEERNYSTVGAGKWFRHSGEGSSRQKPVSAEVGLRQFHRRGDRNLRMISSGRSSDGDKFQAQRTEPPAGITLNPSVKEWNPLSERVPEEDRCLFMTFSNGYPLTEGQIVRFFTNKFGPCVEKVYVHRHPRNVDAAPLFGKVVFSVSYIPAVILGGDSQTKFVVEGKHLWCKKFEGMKNQAQGFRN